MINQTAKAVPHKRYEMTDYSKFTDEFQKVSKEGFQGYQAIAAEVTNYWKKVFENGTRALEQLVGAKSVEHAVEVQSQYVKKTYEAHIAEMTKLSEMYVSLAQNAFKPLSR